jgi:hypothetical protein
MEASCVTSRVTRSYGPQSSLSVAKLDLGHGARLGAWGGESSQRKWQSKWVGDGGWMGMGNVVGGGADGLPQLSLFDKASMSGGWGA